MPYIGNTIRAADDYRLIDDISSSFNGSTTSFALQVAGSAPVPFPKSPQQVLISVNGVIQEPDPSGSSGFNLVGTNIVFSSAPTNGHAFFGIIYATADYLNAGGNFPAGSLGAPSITFIGDENTGFYRKGGGSIGFVADATEIANTDSNGLTISSGNLIIPDSIIHGGDSDTKIRFGAANEFSVETAGVERFEITPTEVTFNDTGVNTDFRIEGDSVANLFKIDASVDNIGIGMASPTFSSGNGIELADNFFLGFGSGNGTRPDFQFGTTAGATLDIRCGTGADTVDLVINTSGFLGLGTTSPARKLHVDSSFIRVSDGYGLDTSGATERVTLDNGFISLTTNSLERLRINSSGNVGIGTTSPINPLHVVLAGTDIATFESTDAGASGAQVSFKHTSASPADNDTIANLTFDGRDDGNNATTYAQLRVLATDVSNTNESGAFQFFTRNAGTFAERMRIDSSGNVMIGLNSTSNKFHVEGTTTGSRFGVDLSSSGITALAATNESNADVEFVIYDGRSSIGSSVNIPLAFHTNGKTNEVMRLDTSGRLLIGATSSIGGIASHLQVVESDGGKLAFARNDTTVSANADLGKIQAFGNDNDGNYQEVAAIKFQADLNHGNNDKPGRISFLTTSDGGSSSLERMRLTSAGALLINRTAQNDDELFSIFTDSTTPEMMMLRNNAAGSSKDMITMMHVKDSGTIHAIRFKRTGGLNNVGSITTEQTSTAFNTSSDYRLKENAVVISDGITRLKTLKPYRFNFKIEPDKTVDGFFAHEVTAVPEAITGEKDAVETTYYTSGDTIPDGKAVGDVKEENAIVPQSLDYSKITPLLTAALQEAIAKIEVLETEVAALKAA